MFTAALRPASFAARAAFKPARTAAARALSTTAARRSGHPAPQIFGEGAKTGEIPTDENQATGLERLQVLGAIEGVDVFDLKPLDSSRIGTLADPIKVFSMVSLRRVSPYPSLRSLNAWSRLVGYRAHCWLHWLPSGVSRASLDDPHPREEPSLP